MNTISFDLWLMPLVGAIIGWLTNILAVRMLFRPHRTIQLPGTPWSIQGLIPKRQSDLAKKIGEVVEKQLLSQEDVLARVNTEDTRNKLVRSLAEIISLRLGERLPVFLPPGIRQVLVDLSRDLVKKEAPAVLARMGEQLNESICEHMPIKEMVEEKVKSFDLFQLEAMVLKVAAKELRHIEILGGVLGFGIGVIQALLSWTLR